MKFNLIAVMVVWVLLPLSVAHADTVVTTYVTKVQEERESTRWTLTEWLRIKERMKMMDVWLAMFSDPQKDRFAPELDVSGRAMKGNTTIDLGGVEESANLDAKTVNVQMWLTNLISQTTRLRTLNIDFGVEGYLKETDNFVMESAGSSTVSALRRKTLNRYYTGNFRVFGRNIQDSSLVLKIGQYRSSDSLVQRTLEDPEENHTGLAAGAELQLYVFKWLGMGGNFMKYGTKKSISKVGDFGGYSADYGPYIEISLFRIEGGKYIESWDYRALGLERASVKDEGYYAGVKILI